MSGPLPTYAQTRGGPDTQVNDKSLFEVVNDRVESAIKLNSDLNKISDWSHSWKINSRKT